MSASNGSNVKRLDFRNQMYIGLTPGHYPLTFDFDRIHFTAH